MAFYRRDVRKRRFGELTITKAQPFPLATKVYGWQVIDWQVIDCHVAVTTLKHSSPSNTPAYFRGLTPLVLASVLSVADTVVCETLERFRVEVPSDILLAFHVLLSKSGAAVQATEIVSGVARLEGAIPSAKVQGIRQQLPGLSNAAGIMETAFDHHTPLRGPPPIRSRTAANPFDRSENLVRLR